MILDWGKLELGWGPCL